MDEGDDSQVYPLTELVNDQQVTLNAEFNPGDTMVYHINQDYKSK